VDLKISDIIKLIKTCKEQGVQNLDGFGLKLAFFENASHKVEEDVKIEEVPSEVVEVRKKEDLELNEIELKMEKLADLRLTDPYQYEQLIALDELGEINGRHIEGSE
jgi:hypothetical protein